MPKGKKFEAAEKHFLKKEEAYQKTIKFLRQELAQVKADLKSKDRALQLEIESNELLRQENAALQETAGLSKSDVRELVKKAESLNAVTGIFKSSRGGVFV